MSFQDLESFEYENYLVMIHKFSNENILECWLAPVVYGQGAAGDKIAVISIHDFRNEASALEVLRNQAIQTINERKKSL